MKILEPFLSKSTSVKKTSRYHQWQKTKVLIRECCPGLEARQQRRIPNNFHEGWKRSMKYVERWECGPGLEAGQRRRIPNNFRERWEKKKKYVERLT